MSDVPHSEIGEPHPFCVCKPFKTYCDYGKVTTACVKKDRESFNWARGQAFRTAARRYWRKAKS